MSLNNQQVEKRVRVPRSESKTAKAEVIFKAMPDSPRKDVLKEFESQLDLTPKGASTYYQTLRQKNGLVTPRPAPKSAH